MSGEGGPLAIIRIHLGSDELMLKLGHGGSTKTLMIDQQTTFSQLRDDLLRKLSKGMDGDKVALLNSAWRDYMFRLVADKKKDDGTAESESSTTGAFGEPSDAANVWSLTQTSAQPAIQFVTMQEAFGGKKAASKKSSAQPNKKRLFGKTSKAPASPTGSGVAGVFGCKLISLCTWAGYTWMLPAWILESIDLLIANTDMVGLFRISAAKTELDELRQAIESGASLQLADWSVHAVAGVLKMFLHEMPASLFPDPLVAILEEIAEWDAGPNKDLAIKSVVYSLPEPTKTFWLRLNQLFRAILERQELNKMTADNLAVVFSPAIFRAKLDVGDDIASVTSIMAHQRIAAAIIAAAANLSIPPRHPPAVWARHGTAPASPLLCLYKLDPATGMATGVYAASGIPCPLQLPPASITVLFRCENAPPPLRMRRTVDTIARKRSATSLPSSSSSSSSSSSLSSDSDADRESTLLATCQSLLQLCFDYQSRLAELRPPDARDADLADALDQLQQQVDQLAGGPESPVDRSAAVSPPPPSLPPVLRPRSPTARPSSVCTDTSLVSQQSPLALSLPTAAAAAGPPTLSPRPPQRPPRSTTPPPPGSPKLHRTEPRSRSPTPPSSKPLVPPPSLFTPANSLAESRGRQS